MTENINKTEEYNISRNAGRGNATAMQCIVNRNKHSISQVKKKGEKEKKKSATAIASFREIMFDVVYVISRVPVLSCAKISSLPLTAEYVFGLNITWIFQYRIE